MATHQSVTHAWAHQTGKNRKGFNMFYDGPTIYSYGYHFPIARLVTLADGREVVLFTNRKYSVSTSKHVTYTRRAVNHMVVFSVTDPSVDPSRKDVEEMLEKATLEAAKSKRARVYKASHLQQALSYTNEAQALIEAFSIPGFENYNWDLEAIQAQLDEAAANRMAQEAEARRLKAERERKQYREDIWPSVKRWLRGEVASRQARTSRPLPRISSDIVETTWGATVPLAIAIKLYHKALECRRTHVEYVPPRRIHVGDFALTRIKSNGDLVVGCHDIPFWFMRYAACRNNIPSTPSLSV